VSTSSLPISRREFVGGTAALIVGIYLTPHIGRTSPTHSGESIFAPNAFVRVAADDTVTVIVKHIEFGQGSLTGLTTLVAEELGASWAQMRAQEAPVNTAVYNNLSFGPLQGTGGSSSIANSYEQMRKAGAIARLMLVQAAANAWIVPAEEITTENGLLFHQRTARSGSFGEFADAASRLPVPGDAPLKDPAAFRFIGRDRSVGKLDVPDKSNGKAQFTIDIHEPGMLTVVVARPPRFGARVLSFDPSRAKAVRGVVDIKEVPSGIAVYARSTWPALKGRKTLRIVWDESGAETRGTPAIAEHLKELAMKPGMLAASHGDIDAAFGSSDRVIETEYVFPYLAHAPMEPLDGFMNWDGERVSARYGSQIPTLDQMQIGPVFGVSPEKVEIATMLAGGSFGRRIDLGHDMVSELAAVAKAIGPKRPVKLMWTREDDIGGGCYRPMMVHRLRGTIRNGKITGWSDTIAGQSFAIGTAFEPSVLHEGIDKTMVDGSDEIPYAVPNFRCDVHIAKIGVPTSSWRSVSSTHTAYAVECFIDQLLEATGQDPVSGRLALAIESPRHAGVLRAAAEMAQWSGAGPLNGRARGVAVAKAFGTFVAQIAEVSIGDRGEPRVHKVWCAVDCGVAVNPDIVRAQMEGGIGFGLGHILYAAVSLESGRPVQKNFDTYRSLRINEMPSIEVRIVPSIEKPSGVGEPGVPPIGPAVANALSRLVGERPRQLPIVGGVA
jgi:isoquinoline 1-oxidoreductase subunit beta